MVAISYHIPRYKLHAYDFQIDLTLKALEIDFEGLPTMISCLCALRVLKSLVGDFDT